MHYPPLFLNLALLYLLTTSKAQQMAAHSVPKLPAEVAFDVRSLIKEEYLKAIQRLKKVKQTINEDER